MILHPEKSLGTGTAFVVAVQADAGVKSLSQRLHLKAMSAGGACWPFLRLTLRSSDASCNFFSSLSADCDSVPVSSGSDPGQGVPIRQCP